VLDVTVITPRLVIVGRPSTRCTDALDRRNNIVELAHELTRRFGDQWCLFNASSKTRKEFDYGKFNAANVSEWQPPPRTGFRDTTPALGVAFRFAHCLSFFSSWGAGVAVLTCDDGLTRSGFLAAAYLALSEGGGMDAALARVSTARLGDAAALTALFPPSWKFLVKGMDALIALPAGLPRAFTLEHLVVRLPRLRAAQASGAGLPRLQLFESAMLIFDSAADAVEGETVRWDDGALLIELPQKTPHVGDYSLLVLESNAEDALPVARAHWHTSLLSDGVFEIPGSSCDVLLPSATDVNSLAVLLLLSPLSEAEQADFCVGRVASLAYLGLASGSPAQLGLGAQLFVSHHHVFPDPKALASLKREGFDETAICASLQRAGNALGRAREYLDCEYLRSIFKEPVLTRQLRLLRETLTNTELATVLAARFNVVVKPRAPQLKDLDFSALIEASKLGQLVPKDSSNGKSGKKEGGEGGGGGRGGGARHHHHPNTGKEAPGVSRISEEEDDDGSSATASAEDAVFSPPPVAPVGPAAPEAVFANTGDAKDNAADDESEEESVEDGAPWTMATHPIFGGWFKQMAAGRSRAELEAELSAAGWAAGPLLSVPAEAEVPLDLPALSCPLSAWSAWGKFLKMLAMGLPRPVVEHALSKESLAPTLLDADASTIPLAIDISPARKGSGAQKGPQCKKLHWTPLKGSVLGTIWAGPPGDLALAAQRLFPDEVAFAKLWIADPKKKQKKEMATALLDPKRAMNCGIALSKIKTSPTAIRNCLNSMCVRDGSTILSRFEIAALAVIAPTEEEVRAVKAYKGDASRLGPVEKFFLVIADVPQCRARSQALLLQLDWDERIRDARAQSTLLQSAVVQLRTASRFQRMLKSVLTLGNLMNCGGTAQKVREAKRLVRAFTLTSLGQLALTKTWDGSASALDYLLRALAVLDPDLLSLSDDFPGETLAEVRRLPLDVMMASATDMRASLTALEELVRTAAQASGDLAHLLSGGGEAVYVDEAAPSEKAGKCASAAAPEGAIPEGGAPSRAKRPRRRRIEPLPTFAALAQNEVAALVSELELAVRAFRDICFFLKEEDAEKALPEDVFTGVWVFLKTWDGTIAKETAKRERAALARKRAKALGRNVGGDEADELLFAPSRARGGAVESWADAGGGTTTDEAPAETTKSQTTPHAASTGGKQAPNAACERRPSGSPSLKPAGGFLDAIKARGGGSTAASSTSNATTAAAPAPSFLDAIKARGDQPPISTGPKVSAREGIKAQLQAVGPKLPPTMAPTSTATASPPVNFLDAIKARRNG
jgi:hypothetical protein